MVKQLFSTVFTAAAGASGKEAAFGGVIAAAGTTLAAALGGWDIAIKLLVFAMGFDYATGVLAAIRDKRIDSDIMLWGGIRKIVVGGVIAFGVLLDQFFGNDAPVLRTIAVYFYLGREGLSIVENLGKLNILVPDGIKDKLQQLKGKEDGRGDV